jgi:hypothetical protein
MALDDIPSRFVLDVVREMSPELVPSWNVGLERWFDEHESTTVDEYAVSFLQEHNLTPFGEAPVARWASSTVVGRDGMEIASPPLSSDFSRDRHPTERRPDPPA